MAHRKLLIAFIVLLIAGLACNLNRAGPTALATQPPDQPVITEAPVRSTDTVMVPTNTSAPLTGFITGTLSYPSEFIPPQKVVAFDTANMSVTYSVTTELNQGTYSLEVPTGKYLLVAYVIESGMPAGYSQSVLCGLSVDCTDHTLLPVVVEAGATVVDVNPGDWYAPQGTFPQMP